MAEDIPSLSEDDRKLAAQIHDRIKLLSTFLQMPEIDNPVWRGGFYDVSKKLTRELGTYAGRAPLFLRAQPVREILR